MSDQIWWYFKCDMCCIVKTVLCLMCRNRDLIINSTSGTVFFIALITQWPAHTQQTVYAGCHGCERAGCSTKQWLFVIHPRMVQWLSGMLSCKKKKANPFAATFVHTRQNSIRRLDYYMQCSTNWLCNFLCCLSCDCHDNGGRWASICDCIVSTGYVVLPQNDSVSKCGGHVMNIISFIIMVVMFSNRWLCYLHY